MKKNRITLIILLVLAGVAGYFIYTGKKSTIKEELRDFAVEDTGAVDKIFMADKSGQHILLEKKSDAHWTVNGKYPARNDGINMLLSTLKSLEVRSPVGKAAREFIIKDMAAKSLKVEIYQHGNLAKTFYVGGSTQDQLGTYMYLQNSSVPFIIHIPGFDGYLTPRFIINEGEWKIKSIFAFNRGEISSVLVENTSNPEQSFELKKIDDDHYALFSFPGAKPEIYKDSAAIQAYLSSFQFINYERPVDNMPAKKLDSVLTAGPFMKIQTTDISGKKTLVSLYLKPSDENIGTHYDEAGNLLPLDPDRMIARLNNDSVPLLVQYFVFNKLMKQLDQLKDPAFKPKR